MPTATQATLAPDRAGPPRLIPPFVAPSPRPLGRLASMSRYIRNPLSAIPAAVY